MLRLQASTGFSEDAIFCKPSGEPQAIQKSIVNVRRRNSDAYVTRI